MPSAQASAPEWTLGRKIKGERYRSAPCGHSQVFQVGDGPYMLRVPRGTEGHGDNWGPLAAKDDAAAVAEGLQWDRRLERAGWFKVTTRDGGAFREADMAPCLAKLPRSPVIPQYLLHMVDRLQAEQTEDPVHGNRIFIGGRDVHALLSNDAIAARRCSMDIAITAPGSNPDRRDTRNARLRDLSVHELDALIELLLRARMQMLSEETNNAINTASMNNLPAPSRQDNVMERYRLIIGRNAQADRLLRALLDFSNHDLSAMEFIANAIANGDALAGATIIPRPAGQHGVAPVAVTADSNTGKAAINSSGAVAAVMAQRAPDQLH